MAINPAHRWEWECGPTIEFEFPPSTQADLVRDFIRARFGLRGLSGPELEWLGSFIAAYLEWTADHSLPNQERAAAVKMVRVLSAIDEKMSSSTDPSRSWAEIAVALGLPSACFGGLNGTGIAARTGLTKMAISKSVHKFLRVVEMESAFSSNGKHLNFH